METHTPCTACESLATGLPGSPKEITFLQESDRTNQNTRDELNRRDNQSSGIEREAVMSWLARLCRGDPVSGSGVGDYEQPVLA